MGRSTQISAYVSDETREELEKYAEANGLKKGHVVEMALLHHLAALRELPADIVVPPRLVVTAETGAWLLEQMENPPAPTDAMRALFAAEGSPDDELDSE